MKPQKMVNGKTRDRHKRIIISSTNVGLKSLRNDDMVISYGCFHFGPKYYKPAASNGHRHNRALNFECSNSECRAKTTAGSFMHAVRAYKWQEHG